MKKLILTSILALLVAAGTTAIPQDYPDEYLGLPGDNLNLYAVMKLFQESETLEGFERSLNDENSRINNLDLNGDNLIDYITVQDYVDGDVHTIVLRVALNRNEFQDAFCNVPCHARSIPSLFLRKIQRNRFPAYIPQHIGAHALHLRGF